MILPDEAKERIRVLSRELFDKGRSPREALGLAKETIESLYASAYSFYQGGNHSVAAHFFRLLALLSPEDPRFYLGIGASLHRMREYANAALYYQMAADLDPKNPLPEYYRSDCYIELGQYDRAVDCLKSMISRAGSHPQYAVLVGRAQLSLSKLS